MKKFEYRTEIASQHSADSLTLLGKEGWELIDVYNGIMFLKREIEPEARLRGPRIANVLHDFDTRRMFAYDANEQERLLNFLQYCKSVGVEWLVDCIPYAIKRGEFFASNVQAILDEYEFEYMVNGDRLTIEESDIRIEDEEKERIKHALEICNGNHFHAANRLGMSKRNLEAKIKKYQL